MPRANFVDITGNRYGRLKVLGFHHTENHRGYWVCECECKRIVVLRKDHFAYPYSHQKSCGCLHSESSSARMKALHEKRRKRMTTNELHEILDDENRKLTADELKEVICQLKMKGSAE